MAPAHSKRQSRKRRKARPAPGTIPVARSGALPARAPERTDETALGALATTFTGHTYGDPPPNPFGAVPVSEIAIFAGAIGVVVWGIDGSLPSLIVGIVVCTLGVLEFTAREHFSGYRSHAALLAGVPAVAVGVGLIALDSASLTREVLIPVVVAVFGGLLWFLRNRFRVARQARIVRPPEP